MPQKKMIRPSIARLALSFLLALIAASVLGSLSQSYVNLLAIAALTGGIDLTDALATYGFDLLNFAPTLALILLPTLLVALVLAAGLQRLPFVRMSARNNYILHFFSAAVIFYLALTAINYIAPMPTLIAANRSLPGTLALLISSGLGALIFAALIARNARSRK